MLEHCRAEFELDLKQEAGCSVRQHLQAAQAATGVVPAALRTPPCPPSLWWLLACWRELACARQAGFGVPQPLAWQDIAHWQSLTLNRLTPWELQLLRRIDLCWLEVWSRCRDSSAAGRQSKPPPASRAPREA